MAGTGCQPGDLTKRMAIPWQADFFDCSVQDVNFTTAAEQQDDQQRQPDPAGADVLRLLVAGAEPVQRLRRRATRPREQALEGNAFLGSNNVGQVLGQNVLYHRGLNSFFDSVVGWKYLGFILNTTTGPAARDVPVLPRAGALLRSVRSGLLRPELGRQLHTTQPTTVASAAQVNDESQNVFPVQWLVGN